jgi:regulator of cell morphogenesis and NO signaling
MKTQALTLADLAISRPGASQVFLAHGLDFCCGGRRPLDEACREKGLDPDALLREIDAADATAGELTRWAKKPLAEVIGFIEDYYHARLRSEIPELIALADKVEEVHVDKSDCPRGLAAHLRQMHRAVLDHLEKEERGLFPLIRAGQGLGAIGAVHSLELEHDDHGKSLARLRELTADMIPPSEACPTWRALYRRLARLADELMEHVSLENHVLFPRALFEA